MITSPSPVARKHVARRVGGKNIAQTAAQQGERNPCLAQRLGACA